MCRFLVVTLVSSLLALDVCASEIIKCSPVSAGAETLLNYYTPVKIELSTGRPKSLKVIPQGLVRPLFATVPMTLPGRTVHIVLDEPTEKTAKLYVDTNGNGDLTDDPPAKWPWQEFKTFDGKTASRHMGNAFVDIGDDSMPFHASIGMYRFSSQMREQGNQSNAILCYRDYAREGYVRLGDKKYYFMLIDDALRGDFGQPGVCLWIDVNGNRKYEERTERFEIDKPFNIGGVTRRVTNVRRDGSRFTLGGADETVPEKLTAPNHSVGSKITPFRTITLDSKRIEFPRDYSGKVVLVDFWATWCAPCIVQIKEINQVYKRFHDSGFEVLSVSLDRAGAVKKIKEFCSTNKISWPQVYEGKGFKGPIAKAYAVSAVPLTFLVDGDTGVILASGPQLHGERLEQTVAAALKAQKQ